MPSPPAAEPVAVTSGRRSPMSQTLDRPELDLREQPAPTAPTAQQRADAWLAAFEAALT